jgi:outer membrane protein OmpA-like peptidoglycan-associated protein
MIMHKGLRLAAILGLIVLMTAAVGCVSNKKFKDHVDNSGARVNEVQSGVEANEQRIEDLRTETDGKIAAAEKKADAAMKSSQDAMKTAKAADAKANGKVLWEVTMTNEDVKFDLNEFVLTAQGKSTLDGLIGKVKGLNRAAYVEVAGHTDSTGSEKYNMGLGLKRAEMVRTYMNQQGVPLHMMSVISFGESKPIADNSTKEGRSQNRRVVIRVLE